MKKFMKRFIHKFIIDEKGAVSIYLIIITLLLFLFNAVLIDYARIIIAERQTEEAAKTALRSTMASYNQALQDKGLFAYDLEKGEPDAIFQEVFKKNLQSGEGDGFNYLGLQSVEDEVSTDMHLERSLANKNILEYQILEEMKYKAPVEIAESIIEGFLAISDEMEQASTYSKAAKPLNEKAEERDKLVEDARLKLVAAKADLDDIKNKIEEEPSSREGEGDIYPKVEYLYDVFYYHQKFIKHYKNEDSTADERKDAKKFKENASNMLSSLVSKVEHAKENTKDALEHINEAMEVEEEMEEIYEDAKKDTEGSYSNAKEQNKSDIDFDDEGGLGDAIDSLDDYFFGEEFYEEASNSIDDTLQNIDKENGKTDSLLPKLKEFEQVVKDNFPDDRRKGKARRLVETSQKFYRDVLPILNTSIEIIESKQDNYEEKKEDDGETTEDKEKEADDQLEDSKETLDDIEDDINSATGDTDLYQDVLKDLVIKYEGAIEENGEKFNMEDRDEASEDAMNFIDLVFEEIGSKLISARDELYKNEYIMMRFASHNFEKSGTDANVFENNQVEYIIYGQNAYGTNYFSALSEIFAIRFAINFVASLLDIKKKLAGPFMWITTIADALIKTADDMGKITEGDPVELFPGKRKPRTTYHDYLRIFLFVHPEGKKTERTMAVLDHITKTDLTQSPTYITGNATSSMKLWFLPGVAKILEKTNAIEGRVEGNKYFIEKEVNYSY